MHCCQLCDRPFRRKGSLKVHIRTHSGEKQYDCPPCNKYFTQSDNLKAHTRAHTKTIPAQMLVTSKKHKISHPHRVEAIFLLAVQFSLSLNQVPQESHPHSHRREGIQVSAVFLHNMLTVYNEYRV